MQKIIRLQIFTGHILILIILVALILAPRPLGGYLKWEQARRYESAGNHSAAAGAFAFAAARLPWQASLWEKAGSDALAGGDPVQAAIYLKQAATAGGISPTGWATLGMAYEQLGNLPLAVNAWDDAGPLTNTYPNMAQDLRKMGELYASMETWGNYVAQKPGDANGHYQLGLFRMAFAPENALPELMQAARLNPAIDPSVQKIRSALDVALTPGYDASSLFIVSGQALGDSGNWDLAKEAFQQAVAMQDHSAEAWAWLSEAEQQLGQDNSNEIKHALAINPDSAMVQGLYGLYLQRQKQPQEAVAAFQKAAALDPQEPGWQAALGGAYEQAGDLLHALAHYQNATALSPNQPDAWRALAEFSLRNNVDMSGTGLPAARRLVELVHSDWQADDIAGQILLGTGDIVGAEAMLEKAIELGPTQAAPCLHLGLLYVQNGNSGGAYFFLNQARLLDPDGPVGWQAGRLLEQYFP